MCLPSLALLCDFAKPQPVHPWPVARRACVGKDTLYLLFRGA